MLDLGLSEDEIEELSDKEHVPINHYKNEKETR